MRKSLVALAAFCAMTAPAFAQATEQAPEAQEQAQPQTIKKRVCTKSEPMTGSRIGGKKVCKTIEVPANASDEAGKDPQSDTGAGATN
jgi:hypothetical protein